MKHIISVLVSILAACVMGFSQDLVILHVNDTHSHEEPLRDGGTQGGMGGVIERAAYVDSVRTAVGKKDVLLLHAGDFSQGTSYFTELGGDIEIDLINAMKYDVVTLGNHEFDNGIDELARRLDNLRCPVVCANYDFSELVLGKYVKPYAIVRKGGMKIGVIGLLTDVTRVVQKSIADKMKRFDDIEVANKWADYLKNEEHCDMVIALTHIGFDSVGMNDPALVAGTRNIDLVVGGHSHTFLTDAEYRNNLDGRPVPIVQDGCWGLFVGQVDVYRNK